MAKFRPTAQQKLKQVTARDFGGGLNKVDSEFNLNSRYAVDGYNMLPDTSGGLQVRWGTRLFAAIPGGARIAGMTYYFGNLIAATTSGTIYAVNGAGVVTQIWGATIASHLPGAPLGWKDTMTTVNFAQYLGELIVTNGVDKPVVFTNTLAARYLQDLGSGSNIHVPVAKYVCVHDNYVVMAGDPLKPGRLYISNAGTSGTWVGDALPNDAVNFDVDKYTEDATGEITGILSWRDRVLVFFSQCIVSIKLGTYTTATPPVHTPTVDDVVKVFGAVGQRAMISTGDTVLFLDYTGVSLLKQATFTTNIQPSRVSTLVDMLIQRALAGKSTKFLQDNCHAVYDKREKRIYFFIPSTSDPLSSSTVFVASLRPTGEPAWNVMNGWSFQGAAVSQEGRVFFSGNKKLYLYGSSNEPILSDFEGDVAYDGPATENVGVYVNGIYTPPTTRGKGISFYHEFPHSPLGDRTVHKTLAYVGFDTQGASAFTLRVSLDDTLKRGFGLGELWNDSTLFSDGYGLIDGSTLPLANYYDMGFIGGDRGAYAVALPTQSPDGYRPTDNMGLYALYGRGKFVKLSIRGTSYSHLRLASLSLHYNTGSIY